jgi:glycosyltransferase involved in cell wall biosynthesis
MRGERHVQRGIYRLADHVIVHGEGDRDRLVSEFGLGRDRISVIPHGDYSFFDVGSVPSREEARRWLGVSPDAEVALFFGFIREYKGLDVLLDAWPEVARGGRRRTLVVAGDPARLEPARARAFEARARALGAIHHFRYVPFEDVPRYFAAADTLVLPYRRISQSGVLLLAMSMGVPVVATRVGAFPEVLTDGENGILLPPGDVASLTHALDRVLGDADLRAELAGRARETIERVYSWSAIAERTETLFRQLARPRTGPVARERTMTNG